MTAEEIAYGPPRAVTHDSGGAHRLGHHQAVLLDWSKTATVGKPTPCVTCGESALLRNPDGRPQHKVCAERLATEQSYRALGVVA